MRSVALICEGPTDQIVLERLLDGLTGGQVRAVMVQPPRPLGPGDYGGWRQVFLSIERGDVSGALAAGNDAVVVQIDTDVCEEAGFDVSRRTDGRPRTEAELVAAVSERLRSVLVGFDPRADLARVVLAICVNELECWLLLHLAAGERTTGCLKACNRVLKRQDRPTLGSGEAKKPRAYEDVAAGLRKRKAIDAIRGRSPSLDRFLTDLSPLISD
jgi:hypothetical protein